ncbi:protein LAZY 1-like [Benincasa hispida]|uniref:protein LAZY 1-like n=1 Tax=Benincasa hispida TaxID=102211 RepID=UPI0019019F3E|nr:protein LAZY 1-like [Benincasa hispida]XP_038878355.1 protein LAZY 1-like [Benincasa hispida]
MKLLGWMHRKFKQNSGQPLKDFVVGQQASDHDQQYFPRTSINNPLKQAQRDLDAARSDEDYEEESLISISEIFPGFLAIGTLGSSEPATPKFSISIDHITERDQTEVTKNELKLINDELEKVLEADAKHDDGGSRRDSHVSKVLEGQPESNNVESGDTMVCPLQGYLFGSAVELSTTMAKKENRTSLGELFQRSKVLEEGGGGRCEKDDQKQVEKEGDKCGMQFIKKKLKKKMFSAASKSSLSSTASGGVLDVSNATKLHKILHLFNRKVYPAESIAMAKGKGDHKAQKNDKKKKTTTTVDGLSVLNRNKEERTSTGEDNMIYPKKLILKQTLQSYQTRSVPPQFSDDICDDDVDSNWNKEQ